MKKIREMSIEEMRDELIKFCKGRPCGSCPLSLVRIFSHDRFTHSAIESETDLYKLALMLEITRGGLVWKDQAARDGADVQCAEAEVCVARELEIDDDSTGIMITGKKPAMMTIYFDEPAD